MKTFYKSFAIIVGLFLSFSPNESQASHVAGGELLYRWVRDSTYKVSFKFYRDCSGAGEPGSFQLCYSNASCETENPVYLTANMVKIPNTAEFTNGDEIATGCPGYSSTCVNPQSTFPGYREWVYDVEVTLPTRCSEWRFWTSLNARNPSTNILGAGTAYFEATLNNLDVQNNSSPFFSVKPVPYACAYNSPYTYNNGAVDINSDSLTFSLITPRNLNGAACGATGNPVPVSYSTAYPYSATNPLQNSAIAFSSVTGQLDFTATQPGSYTLTVLVSDYRNGIKVGSVLRDIQLQILPCSSPQPVLNVDTPTVVNATLDNEGRVLSCANTPFQFCFKATSTATTAILVAGDNHNSIAPGSNVVYTGIGTPSIQGCFSWTPGTSDTGLKIFTVTIKDSNCAPPGILISQTFTIPIFIRPAAISFRSLPGCPGNPIPLTSNGTGNTVWGTLPNGSGPGSLSCINCSSTIARPLVSTVYYAVSQQPNGCANTDTFDVVVDNSNSIKISGPNPLVVCDPTTIPLNVTTTGPLPLLNLSCGAASTVPASPEDTVIIIPANAKVQTGLGSPSTPMLENYASGRHQYLMLAKDLRYSGQNSGTITGLSFKFSPNAGGASMRDVRISMKCTEKSSLSAANGFETGALPVLFTNVTTSIPAGGGNVRFDFTTPYNWDTTQNLIVDFCFANSGPVGAAPVTYSTTPYSSNLFAFTNNGSLCNVPNAPNLTGSNELPVITFYYHLAPEGDWTYNWYNGVFLPHANVNNPTTYVPNAKQIWVTTKNRTGCLLIDTLNIYVPDFKILPKDSNICAGHPVQLQGLNGKTYQWYEAGFAPATTLNCTTCPDPIGIPSRTTTYIAVIGDQFGCTDTFFTEITVTPFPDVKIITPPTTIVYGESITLEAVNADNYFWSPVNYLSNPNFRKPVAKPEQTTVYTVMGTPAANSNCRAYDSVRISVSEKWPILVPSVFSPNGDGRNDFFRVVNLTFQKVQEFRVFNRWGQQVFSGNDNSGWDGTTNGKTADMDSYHYIIRLALPSGESRMFKGDVTLVR